MHALPVLMCTQDDALWHHWEQIQGERWSPVRGRSLEDLVSWEQEGGVLAVLDAGLPHLPAWDDLELSRSLERLKVLVLTSRPNDDAGRQCLARGACGYAHAYSALPEIDRILQSIVSGNIWMGRSLLQRLLQDVNSRLPGKSENSEEWTTGLTLREQEVARQAAIGQSNQNIADNLGITERTVRAHLSAIFEKMHINDRLMLALIVHGIKNKDC